MESEPLLGHPQRSSKGLSRFLTEHIRVKHAYLPLLLCCFITGLVDAGSYNAWSVFMGMQTGNTIFLALSTAGLPAGGDSFKWARSGLSIVSLVLGSLITGRIYAAAGPTRRVTLVTSFLLQALCVIFAAILVHTDAVPETDPTDKLVLIAIPFLAAQSGAQVVTAKSLGFSEIPTSVLTSIYNDIGSDTQLFAWKNPKRDRRLCAVVMMLLGGISGAWLSCTEGSLSNVLWTGALLKLLIGLGWLFFQAEAEI